MSSWQQIHSVSVELLEANPLQFIQELNQELIIDRQALLDDVSIRLCQLPMADLESLLDNWLSSLYVKVLLKNRALLKMVSYRYQVAITASQPVITLADWVQITEPVDDQMPPGFTGRIGLVKGIYYREMGAEALIEISFKNNRTAYFWQRECKLQL